jgi:hypothetical protein
MVEVLGRKRVFLNAIFGGVTLGALYFLVASGFTLIFGLMRNVNLAHGSLYLLGGYIGFRSIRATGSWLLAFPVVIVVGALLGCAAEPGLPADGGRGTAPDHGHHRPVGGDRRYPAVDLGWAELYDLRRPTG